MTRRRPVPHAWREKYHALDIRSWRHYGVQRGSGYYSRAGATCACGMLFGTTAGKHNYNAVDVRNQWRDHVETAYYGRNGGEAA